MIDHILDIVTYTWTDPVMVIGLIVIVVITYAVQRSRRPRRPRRLSGREVARAAAVAALTSDDRAWLRNRGWNGS